METKEMLKKLKEKDNIKADFGLEIFEIAQRELTSTAWQIANWYIIYDLLHEANADIERNDMVMLADTCYDMYLNNSVFEVTTIAQAIVNLLNRNMKPKQIEEGDIFIEAESIYIG